MKYLSFIIIFLFAISVSGQKESADKEENRWFTGGGVTFSASNQFIAVGVNPILGYKVTEKISTGVGLTGSFLKYGNNTNVIYGGNIFGRYLITNELFAQSEFHMTNVQGPLVVSGEELIKSRVWSPQWFIGGGYRSSVSDNVFVSVTVLWDVIEDENSPYVNPYITGGIQIRI